jgi:hypothetical protein
MYILSIVLSLILSDLYASQKQNTERKKSLRNWMSIDSRQSAKDESIRAVRFARMAVLSNAAPLPANMIRHVAPEALQDVHNLEPGEGLQERVLLVFWHDGIVGFLDPVGFGNILGCLLFLLRQPLFCLKCGNTSGSC